jgi:ParB/RepB/Spo0J family partition protein
MTTSQRIGRMRKLSRAEIAETPGLDAAAALEYSARNTPGLHDRHEYDLLRVEWIRPSPRNPRKHFDEAGLQELADSIRQVGLLEPVVVRPAADSSSEAPRFELIAGERRWRAAQLASLTDLPAIIRRDVDDALQLRLALLENLQRQDLDALEEAEGYRQLQELGMKQGEIAAAVHRSQPAIANAMRLLKLPPEVQDLIRSGQLTVAHGLAILRFAEFPKVRAAIGKRAAKEGTPTKDLERQRLPWEWELADKGVVKRLPWDNPHKTTCNACPLKARKDEVCLLPSHWNELEEARKTAERLVRPWPRSRSSASGPRRCPWPRSWRPGATVTRARPTWTTPLAVTSSAPSWRSAPAVTPSPRGSSRSRMSSRWE